MANQADHVVRWSLLVVFSLAGTGCSSLSKKTSPGKSDWSISKLWKEEFQRPSSMAAIWSYDELIAENRPSERGFGGRIYFYNERSQAIPVDGDLMVHGYLTTPKYAADDKVAPDKKFEFPAEKLSAHFSPSDIGASYSVWVPWDAVGGYREEITLIPTFKSKDGGLVQGTPAKLFLKGKAREPSDIETPSVLQVSYQKTTSADSSTGASKESAKTRTTTIGLTERRGATAIRRNAAELTVTPTGKSKSTRQSFTLTAASMEKPSLDLKSEGGALKNTVLPVRTGSTGSELIAPAAMNGRMPAKPQPASQGAPESYELRSLRAPSQPARTPTASLPSVRDLEKGVLSFNATRGQSA
ncbi:MAG: hypothetical protein AB8B50_19695 [Pirellulaceae bacterium]